MTTAVQSLLESFDSLSDAEKREAVAEVLRRAVQLAPPQLSDDELTAAAEELFLELDAREAADARP